MDTTQISLKKYQTAIRRTSGIEHLWVVAGDAAGVGCTTVSLALTDLLKRHGQAAGCLDAAGLFDDTSTGSSKTDNDFHAVPVDMLKEINKILQHTALYRYNFDLGRDFMIIDAGARLSAPVLDLFLVADFPILMMRPDTRGIDNAKRFFKICLLKLLDVFFDVNDSQLRSIIDDLESFAPFSTVIMRRIRSLRRVFPAQARLFESFMVKIAPRLLLNRCTAEQIAGFSNFYFHEAATTLPPSTTVMGVLQEYSHTPNSILHLPVVRQDKKRDLAGIESILHRKMSAIIGEQC